MTLSLTRRSFAQAVVADCVILGITVTYPLGVRRYPVHRCWFHGKPEA